ncbi:MAG: hypothetical protein Q9188_005297 [Gyalolechia gomerana]
MAQKTRSTGDNVEKDQIVGTRTSKSPPIEDEQLEESMDEGNAIVRLVADIQGMCDETPGVVPGVVSDHENRGLTNSFGVFQTYYKNVLLPDTKLSVIAWIGSVQIFLMMLIGVCAGWLLDAGYLQFMLIVGTTMTTLGMFMLSLCTTYWQILLAQAFCVGIGSGLLCLTSAAVIPLYFRKKRMIATGIAATGSSIGMSSCRRVRCFD